MARRRGLILFVAAIAAFVAAGVAAAPFLRGLAFVIRATDVHGVARRLADLDASSPSEHGLTVPTRDGPLRARLYEPGTAPRRTVLLVSGLNPAGINEPRLITLARQLAASGVAVVTPEIPDLVNFAITPAITDAIESAAGWLAGPSGLARGRRIGMMGISFSGGLSIVAAARPSLRGHVAYIFSFGGHDDLPRVLRYLCTGIEPTPEGGTVERPPHDYGVAVILLAIADRVVPPEQAAPLGAAVRRYLEASQLDMTDKPAAAREFAALRDVARTLPEPSATLLGYVNGRDVKHLGPRLLPYIADYGQDPALSPSKSPKPAVPVFLLHGLDDNVVPVQESQFLAEDLRAHAPVRLLLSDLISHAEADRPMHVRDVWQLAGFWGELLGR